MKISTIKIDQGRERGGVWVRWIEDASLKIASANSREYRDECRSEFRKHRSRLNQKHLSPDDEALRDRILMRAAARHLLIDWKGIEDDDGNAIPYTAETGFQFFSDESFRMLFAFVVEFARDDANFIAEQVEEDRGN